MEAYFRKGFGLRTEVKGALAADYGARLVDRIRAGNHVLKIGDLTVRLARELGFCYGVERAVEYAYQTCRKFPERRIHLLGEIIHNPHVNARLRGMGIEMLLATDGRFDLSHVGSHDVVIVPAFGATRETLDELRAIGCIVVDTTCGSVLNVWKRVEQYVRDGFTVLIHGKHGHEETRAIASHVRSHRGGQHLIVRDMEEARLACDFIESLVPGEMLMARLGPWASPGFDPAKHLHRIGVVNQTTMLARESLAIAEEVGKSIARARGDAARGRDLRTFDTICSATQERQDAVLELLREPLDAVVVIGGFNSSNTRSLVALCAEHVPTYHVESPEAIDSSRNVVRYRLPGAQHVESDRPGWLPQGKLQIGISAGASTPDSEIGEVVVRILATRQLELPELD